MTLPTSGSISTDQILAELRVANANRNYPLSLNDADVLALAGKSAPPVTMPDDFYGKSVTPPTQPVQPMTLYPSAGDTQFASSSSGGTASTLASVAVVGGARPLTFKWTVTNLINGMQLVSSTDAPAVNFSRTYTAGSSGSATATCQCLVTDAQGATAMTPVLTPRTTWGNA